MKEQLAAFYRQYINEFLTIERFAAYHDMSEEDATKLVEMGRKFHEELADKPKPKGPPNRKEIWGF